MPSRRSHDSETLRSRIQTGTNRRLVSWFAAAYLVVMFTTMIWVTRELDRSMRRLTGRSIQSILVGNVARVRLHIVELERDAEQLLANSSIRTALVKSLASGSPDAKTPAAKTPTAKTPTTETVGAKRPAGDEESETGNRDTPQSLITRHALTGGWILTDTAGRVVASDDEARIGTLSEWTEHNRTQLLSNKSTLVLPPPQSDAPTMSVLSPLMEENQLLGAFGWLIDPRRYLSARMSITPTDATYVFDRQSRMLTRSRFASRLSFATLETELESTAWQPILIRDPGRFLESPDEIAPDELARRPLTQMADQATRGSAGVNTDGYNDYRGVRVVGAWQWLPEFNLGMAMEIDADEAFAPVNILRRVIVGLFGLLTLAGLCVAGLALWSARLQERLQDRDRGRRRLGQYELTELLGAGGMGSVYRGRHQYLRRDVAIKVLEGEDLSRQSIERFRREVQLTSTLRHPNTIAIYDYGQAHRLFHHNIEEGTHDTDSVFYYVMEYIDGISLQQLIDFYGPQDPTRVIHLLLQICGSIAEAHDAGLIHRDIKPANILLSAQTNSWDFIKVLDFGLVKDLGRVDDTVALTMTRSDSITGTPLYMAPETIRDPTAASMSGDLYSIGAVGYALLTGQTTYDGDSAIDLCLKQLERAPVRPETRLGRVLPDGLQNLIMECLSLQSDSRPASVNELVTRLDALPESGRWTQADSALWWETVFEANRQRTPVETKNPTLADHPLNSAP
ncbi:serine/threonine-protein kinase [Rhodopirellula sp. SWK7]|uniref:serine/threonine-protein kinase n=1 Tax=Rhodopirellula sp. SWK7 TaxID=595460 RepID=UPI0002BDA86D|nr:serine/threonine-protein kinase [Rhodopirellula sp. SWK7]EMI44992.1 serine/threonine-protein kinase [Rhodopirellula sp. SWK7]